MTFDSGQGAIEAVSNLSVSVKENEILSLLGPSGCGKSTVLNLVAGFLRPTSGSVCVDGQPVEGPGTDRAVVFQEDALFPWLTVEGNLRYGPRARGLERTFTDARVEELLRNVRLERYRNLYPRQLSGGMRKRVDLARAFINDPPILLLDEPFAGLDLPTKERMQCELLESWLERPRTIVFVTHDIEEALFLGQRLIVLTKRPARVLREVIAPLPKSPELTLRTEHGFQLIRRELIEVLHVAELGVEDER